MTDLQYDIVAAFKYGANLPKLMNLFQVPHSEVIDALRLALQESWTPSRRQRPKPQHPSEVGTTKL